MRVLLLCVGRYRLAKKEKNSMRLSDAIALGRTLVKPMAGKPLSKDNDYGCTIGMALRAVGRAYNCSQSDEQNWNWWPVYQQFLEEWPWTLSHPVINMSDIFRRFDREVMQGTMTLDQLIDWVRSVEPEEPLPLRDVDVAVKREGVEVV